MKIKEIVEKELEKNLLKQRVFAEELDKLPNGTLVKVKSKASTYVYLKYRDGEEVISKYVGKEDEVVTSKLEMDMRRRKSLEAKMHDLKDEEKLMLKMLKVK